MTTRPLLIFTHHYPFGEMELFLETEIRFLREKFSHIIIIPNVTNGALREVPEGVFVETSFAKTFVAKSFFGSIKKIWHTLLYTPFYQELSKAPKNKACIRKLFGYSFEAARCRDWLKDYLTQKPELQKALFYTYWLYDHTSGITQLKKEFPEISIVSRAHGFDLYEEDYAPPFIPYRQHLLQHIDKIVLISEHGHRYLRSRYPQHSAKMFVSKLGIDDPGGIIPRNNNGTFVIASCSHLIPLKRVHLLIDGIRAFTEMHPEVPLEWHHIGSGPLRKELHAYAEKTLPAQVRCVWAGSIPNKEVFSYYKRIQPSLFLLTSETEGLPVSLMEAYGCGIPAVATDVGGVPEIVQPGNGLLISANPKAEEIGKAIEAIWISPDYAAFKESARFMWEKCHSAQNNYIGFTKLLSQDVLQSYHELGPEASL